MRTLKILSAVLTIACLSGCDREVVSLERSPNPPTANDMDKALAEPQIYALTAEDAKGERQRATTATTGTEFTVAGSFRLRVPEDVKSKPVVVAIFREMEGGESVLVNSVALWAKRSDTGLFHFRGELEARARPGPYLLTASAGGAVVAESQLTVVAP